MVEAGVAEQLNVTLGDTLTFKAGGWEEEVTITSLRKVDWRDFLRAREQ